MQMAHVSKAFLQIHLKLEHRFVHIHSRLDSSTEMLRAGISISALRTDATVAYQSWKKPPWKICHQHEDQQICRCCV